MGRKFCSKKIKAHLINLTILWRVIENLPTKKISVIYLLIESSSSSRV
jgi:hypothetical protein